jgi:hypothetical protein
VGSPSGGERSTELELSVAAVYLAFSAGYFRVNSSIASRLLSCWWELLLSQTHNLIYIYVKFVVPFAPNSDTEVMKLRSVRTVPNFLNSFGSLYPKNINIPCRSIIAHLFQHLVFSENKTDY